jgi:hypothetical protein
MTFTQTQKDEVVALYQSGVKTTELVEKFGMSAKTVQRAVRAIIGPRLRGGQQRYFCDETVFDKITSEGAYWIGMLLTDGFVKSKNDRICLVLKKDDKDHVQKLASFLKTNALIYDLASVAACGLEVHAPILLKRLSDFGIVRRKTWTAKAPSELVGNRHFWRGVIDGDGCIHKHKAGYPCITLVGTKSLCNQFRDWVTMHVSTKANTYQRGPNWWVLSLGGPRYVPLLHVLYQPDDVALDRKAAIASNWMGS